MTWTEFAVALAFLIAVAITFAWALAATRAHIDLKYELAFEEWCEEQQARLLNDLGIREEE